MNGESTESAKHYQEDLAHDLCRMLVFSHAFAQRRQSMLAGAPREPSDRTMTVGELQEAARSARTDVGPDAAARAAA